MKHLLLTAFLFVCVSCLAQDSLLVRQQWVEEHKKWLVGTWYNSNLCEEITFNPDGTGVSQSAYPNMKDSLKPIRYSDTYCVELNWEITYNNITWSSKDPAKILILQPGPNRRVSLWRNHIEVGHKGMKMHDDYSHVRRFGPLHK